MGESTTTNLDYNLLFSDNSNIFIKEFGRQDDSDNSNIQKFIDVINTQLKPDDNFIINPEIAIKDLKSTYDLYNKIYNKIPKEKQDTREYIEFKMKHTKLADINYKRYKKALEILQEKRNTEIKLSLSLEDVITKEVYNNDIMNIVSDVDALKKKWADIITTGKGGITKKKEAITKLISKWYPERVKYLQMLSNVMPGENMSLLEKLKEAAETKNIDTNEKTKEMKRLIYGFYLLLSSDKNSTRVDKQLNNILTNVGLTYKGGADDNNVWKYYSDLKSLQKSLDEFLNKQSNEEINTTQSGKSSWFSKIPIGFRRSSKVAPESDGSQITADSITANGTTSDLSQLNSVVNNLVQLTDANLKAINNLEPNDENKQQLAIYLTLQELINTLIGIIQNIVNVKETIEETIGETNEESNEELNTAITSIIQELITQISEKANPVSSSNLEDAVTAVKEAPGFNKLIEGDINKTIGALIETLPETLKAPEIPEPKPNVEILMGDDVEKEQVQKAFDEIKDADKTLLDQEAADKAAAQAAAALQTNVEPEITAPEKPPADEEPVAAPEEGAPAVAEALQKREEAGSPPDTPMRPGEGFGKDKEVVSHPIYENPLALTTRSETPIEEERPIISMSEIALEKAKAAAAPFPPPSSSSTVASSSRLVAAPQSLTREQNDANIKREIGEAHTYFKKLSESLDGKQKMDQLHEILEYINRSLNKEKPIGSDVPPAPVNPESKKAIILAFMNANISESIGSTDNNYLRLTKGYDTFIKTLEKYQNDIRMSIIYEELLQSILEKIEKKDVSFLITAFRSPISFTESITGKPSGTYDLYIKELRNIFGLLSVIQPLSWIDIISKPGEINKNIPYYLENLGYNNTNIVKELPNRFTNATTYLKGATTGTNTEDKIRKFLNIIKQETSLSGAPGIGRRIGGDLTEEELQKLTDILLMKGGASAQETAKLTPEQMTAIVDKLREQQKLIRVIREDLNILRETYETYSKSVNASKEFNEDTSRINKLNEDLIKANAEEVKTVEEKKKADMAVVDAKEVIAAATTDTEKTAAETAAEAATAAAIAAETAVKAAQTNVLRIEEEIRNAKENQNNVFSDKEILGINDYLKNNIEKIKKINLDTTGNVIKNINSLIQTITSVTKPLETREIFKANRLLLDFLLEGGEIDTIDKSDTNKLLIKKTITDIQLNKLKITPETPNKEIYKGFIPTINEIKRVFEQDIEYYKNVFQQQATGIEDEAKKQERALEKAKLEERERARVKGGTYYQLGGLDKAKRNILNDYLGVKIYEPSTPPNSSNIFEYLNAFEKILNNRYINKIADSSNPAYASIISGDKSTFNQLYEKYLKNKEPPEGSEENATYNMIQGLEMNNLIPREVLKVTLQDKVVFVFASLFIRLITLSVIEYLIEKSVVKTLVVAVLGYLGLFSIIFIAFVMLVNLDMYRLRIVFNYVNFHANSGNVYGYLILLWSFGLIIYYIMRSINTDSRVKSTNEESRVRLMYRIQIVSLIIWLFLVLMIAIM